MQETHLLSSNNEAFGTGTVLKKGVINLHWKCMQHKYFRKLACISNSMQYTARYASAPSLLGMVSNPRVATRNPSGVSLVWSWRSSSELLSSNHDDMDMIFVIMDTSPVKDTPSMRRVCTTLDRKAKEEDWHKGSRVTALCLQMFPCKETTEVWDCFESKNYICCPIVTRQV